MLSTNNITLYLVVLLIFQVIHNSEAQLKGEKCKIKSTGKTGLCMSSYLCPQTIVNSEEKLKHHIENCTGTDFMTLLPFACCPVTLSEMACFKYYPEKEVHTSVHNGEKALSQEFPHMAILGFGEETSKQWLCGGSLISDNFVLTAAHCIHSLEFGTVKWARLGDLDIKDDKDDAEPQDFSIIKTFVHPEYKRASHYHDIALVQLNTAFKKSLYVKAACLPPLSLNLSVYASQLIATGWGKVDFAGDASSHLLKARLNLVSNAKCNVFYKSVPKKKLARGIDEEVQICAGHPNGQDTCQGDSGGPLQVSSERGYNHYYYVVGVTSFGKACGGTDSAGVYVRVAHYLDWIESIVWKK